MQVGAPEKTGNRGGQQDPGGPRKEAFQTGLLIGAMANAGGFEPLLWGVHNSLPPGNSELGKIFRLLGDQGAYTIIQVSPGGEKKTWAGEKWGNSDRCRQKGGPLGKATQRGGKNQETGTPGHIFWGEPTPGGNNGKRSGRDTRENNHPGEKT